MGFPNNEKLTEGLVLLSAVNTASVTTAVLGPAIDLSRARKVVAIFTAGALASAETITCLIAGCATSGGSYTTIAGTSVTLLKSATDDNKSQVIEVSAESINDLGLGYRFIKTSFAGAVGSPVSVVSLGGGGPEEPIGLSAQLASTVKATTVI
jgi:hypothetical protein